MQDTKGYVFVKGKDNSFVLKSNDHCYEMKYTT